MTLEYCRYMIHTMVSRNPRHQLPRQMEDSRRKRGASETVSMFV